MNTFFVLYKEGYSYKVARIQISDYVKGGDSVITARRFLRRFESIKT